MSAHAWASSEKDGSGRREHERGLDHSDDLCCAEQRRWGERAGLGWQRCGLHETKDGDARAHLQRRGGPVTQGVKGMAGRLAPRALRRVRMPGLGAGGQRLEGVGPAPRGTNVFDFVRPAALPVPGQVLSPNTVVGYTVLVIKLRTCREG